MANSNTPARARQRANLTRRIKNLQRRQTNLSRLPMGPPGRWNALGQDAESLYDYIRNHNLTSRAREQGVQSAIAVIISDAIAYSNTFYNRNSGSNNSNARASNSNNNGNNERGMEPRRLFNNNSNSNNNHNYAGWANRHAREIINNKSKKFAVGTKWGVKANKNNAKEWYNSTTGKLKNVTANNVYANGIGGDVFKPGQLKNLYFNANAKGSAARKLYTSRTIKQSQGKNPYTQQPFKPRKLTANMINAVRESMKRRGVNSTKNAKKILGKNATKAAIKKKAMELYMNN